jgi:hypothetical protein
VAYLLAPAKVYSHYYNSNTNECSKFFKPEHASKVLKENPIEIENK